MSVASETESSTMITINRHGNLFVCCIKCVATILIEISYESILQLSKIVELSELEHRKLCNLLVFTSCKRCTKLSISTTYNERTFKAVQYSSVREASLSCNLFRHSRVHLCAMRAIGSNVDVHERNGKIVYISIDEIISKIKSSDNIESLRVSAFNADSYSLSQTYLTRLDESFIS